MILFQDHNINKNLSKKQNKTVLKNNIAVVVKFANLTKYAQNVLKC